MLQVRFHFLEQYMPHFIPHKVSIFQAKPQNFSSKTIALWLVHLMSFVFTFSDCSSTTQTPDPVNSASEDFTIATSQVLLTLATELNYEVAQSYYLIFKVVDTPASKTGSLVVKVTAKC